MKKLNILLLVLAAGCLLLINFTIANACSCLGTPTVLDSYKESNVIVMTRLLSIEKSEQGNYGGISSSKMIIEKVFKGNLKVGDEMTFAQGGGGDCIWTFEEKDINTQFLFYLGGHGESTEGWVAGICGRSSRVADAGDDLLYLNNIKKAHGKTRISGTVRYYNDETMSTENLNLSIIGPNKTYQVKTDRNGVFEIYDLPAGDYIIEPEMPTGWKLDRFMTSYSASIKGTKKELAPNQIPIRLEKRKHAGLDIYFEIDNKIQGKIFDPEGRPLKGVCIYAESLNEAVKPLSGFDCSKEDGGFVIKELPVGSYILAVNDDGRVSSSEPFNTFYYPNTYEREKASVFVIKAGENITGINIYAPEVRETIIVTGRLLYADGKPVVEAFVQFEADSVDGDLEGKAHTATDANGRFSLKILKGLKGKFYGMFFSYVGQYKNCPQIDEQLGKNGGSRHEVRTSEVQIEAEKDLTDIELKYSFTACEKANKD